tara:strand:+ start:10435 stop:12066 length:1632 start_codon:yes stop_codon:yes gene_type:complete
MAASQPFGISCKGGLNTNLNQIEMLAQPGTATKLRNFEVDPDGGYRRISGFSQFGDGTRPNTDNDVFGLHVYADGLIACVGTNIYFSQDGDSWLQINKDSVASGGDNYSTFTGRSTLARTSQDLATFAVYEGTSDYGEVIITDRGSGVKPLYFKMTGTGSALSTRTYFCKEVTVSGTVYPKFCVIHDKHLVVGGAATAPNTIYYSNTLADSDDLTDFTGTGSGSIVLDDQVVGLKSFRDDLIIFCSNSIYKLENINNSSTITITPITQNVGCLDGNSIQEIGGDLVFLSPDGIRTVAGTARIGDVELGSVSRQIQSLIGTLASSVDSYRISSTVLRSKSQYRLFYSSATAASSVAKGIIGTITPNGFEWSETLGIQAHGLTSGFDKDGIEKTYHGDKDGYIYVHDDGNYFTPAGTATNIYAEYQTPNFDFGDVGTRKTLLYTRLSITPEGDSQPTLRVRYDYEDTNIPQPADYELSTIPLPAIFGESSSTFGTATFGASNEPMVRQAVQGSGNTCSFKVFSDDQKAPYAINGFYVDYVPSGRR